MRVALWAWWLVIGCGGEPWAEADVSERLGPGEVRAGVIQEEEALIGGLSAQGRLEDFKIYNDRVQFVVQGLREGNFYVPHGGGIIEADLVREPGQLGRQPVDDWFGSYGFGRLLEPEQVVVLNDGALGDRAVIRVTGRERPLDLLVGALESEDVVLDHGLHFVRDYILEPDSWLLEVRTQVSAPAEQVSLGMGDVLMASLPAVQPYDPYVGFQVPTNRERLWTGFTGHRNDLALGIVAAPGQELQPGGAQILAAMGWIVGGFGSPVEIPRGESRTWSRYYAVTPDLATMTDQVLELHGVPHETVEDQVTAPDGPVAGARVHVMADDAPFTMAVTDDEGRFSVRVPQEADVEITADGRGDGWHPQLPEGASPFGPYAVASLREASMEGLVEGGTPLRFAQGRGLGTDEAPLSLAEPARLVVESQTPSFEARAIPLDDRPALDPRIHPAPAGEHRHVGWGRDGKMKMSLEPGEYRLIVHRGARYELHEQDIELSAGEQLDLEVELPKAYTHDGWLFGDPHQHASPSLDGRTTMEERLISSAAQGVQLHFGTDHDHVADYRPLLEPLGLSTILASVVADEISPVRRGHFNVYPLEPDPSKLNAGAWPWWLDLVPDTETQMERIREHHPGAVVQSNHPSSGLASFSNWQEGKIGRPTYWSENFDAVEVLNGGRIDSYFPFYVDLVSRGLLPTPVGVSDAHGHISGGVGFNGTFIGLGTDDPAAYTDDALVEAMVARRTIVTRGPFLDMSIDPGQTVDPGAELKVEAKTPSWMSVDRLVLWRDGDPIQTVQGTEATFELEAEQDAWFMVIAEGDTPMQPISSRTPWAMSSAIRVDVDGDGWTPPLPPLEVD